MAPEQRNIFLRQFATGEAAVVSMLTFTYGRDGLDSYRSITTVGGQVRKFLETLVRD